MTYLLVFLIAASIDLLYAVFLKYNADGKVVGATAIGGLLSVLGWVSVWFFLDNYWIAIPEILGTCVGIAVGVYLTRRRGTDIA